tara:strand:- start:397 stop:651 length:255 start_codon:yes stop_codon:yes gene_type:complete
MKLKTGDLVLVRHPIAGYNTISMPSMLVPSIIIDVTPISSLLDVGRFFKAKVYNILECKIDIAYNTHIKLLMPCNNPKVGESGK